MLTADEYEDVNDQNDGRNNLNNKPVKFINRTVVSFCRFQTVEIEKVNEAKGRCNT